MTIRPVISPVIRSVVSPVIGGGNGSGGGGGSSIPFTTTSDTFWWDFRNTANTTDDFADDTISHVVERVRGERPFVQQIKGLQPYKVTNGISFNQGTFRHLVLNDVSGFTNGKNGWYVGFNLFMPSDTTGVDNDILNIKGASGNTSSRLRLFWSSTNKIDVRFDGGFADGAVVAQVASGTLSLNTWYTVETYLDLDADLLTLEINAASVATSAETGTTYPASNPSSIVLGNTNNYTSPTVASNNGILSEIIFHNAAPTSQLLTSWGDYLNGVRIRVPDQSTVTATTGNGLINVSLNSYGNGNSPITDHEFDYRVVGAGSWTTYNDGVSATAPTQIPSVTNDTEYEVRHRSQNAIGWSAYSATVTVTPTATPGVPDAIDDLDVVAGDDQLLVFWTKPNANGFNITGHRVYYRISGSGSAFTLFSSPATGSGTLSETITGLTNGVAYEVDVRSVNSQGESASASPTVTETPVNAPNIQDVVASAVMDIDLTVAASYGGSGITLNNLVVSPADGSAQSAYNLQFGDGSTATTYPTFSGTAGTSSGKLTFDGGDHLTLVGSNTAFLNNLHKTTGGTAFTVLMFFETLVDKASTQVFFSTRNGSTQTGITGQLNSAEAMRIEQRGDSAVVTASPALTATLGAPTYLGWGENANGGSGSYSVWSETSTATTGNHTYNTGTSNAAQKLHFCASANATGNAASGTILKAICIFQTKLSNAELAAVAAAKSALHGVTY